MKPGPLLSVAAQNRQWPPPRSGPCFQTTATRRLRLSVHWRQPCRKGRGGRCVGQRNAPHTINRTARFGKFAFNPLCLSCGLVGFPRHAFRKWIDVGELARFLQVKPLRESLLISPQEQEDLANHFTDGAPALEGNVTGPPFEPAGLGRPEDGTVAERIPVESVLRVEHHLERVGLAALPLAGAKKYVEVLGAGAAVRVRNQNRRVQALL